MLRKIAVLSLAATLSLPAAAWADQTAIAARQGQFQMFAFNLGVLGMMAQGRSPYDAEAAQNAADHLFHLTRHLNLAMWPAGSDSDAMAGTRALPVIWTDLEAFATRFGALQDAAAAMQGAAGDGLPALQGAMGGLAGACAACHQNYRAPMN